MKCERFAGLVDNPCTDDTVFRITHDTTGFHATAIARLPGTIVFALGDLDGDYVDDLIGVTFDFVTGIPTVHVFPQCEAKNKACRDANQGPPL